MTKWLALLGLLVLTACPSSDPPSNPGYNVTLLFDSSVQPQYKAAFQSAATRWGQIITGDLPDIKQAVDTSSACGTGSNSVKIPGSVAGIDDVLILVGTFTEGPGGLLGFAGPCQPRTSNGLTGVGQMKFDTADLDGLQADGQLDETITHEMGHVLGFGTLWDSKNLISYSNTDANKDGCDDNPRYIGAKGVAAYKALAGPDATVPVEDKFGPGSCEGHWRESVFKKELMTSFLNDGANPLSKLSIASVEDLGYTVSYAPAEVFALSLIPDLSSQSPPRVRLHSVSLPMTGTINDW